MNKLPKISPYEHIIDSQQFDEDYLSNIFKITHDTQRGTAEIANVLQGRLAALLFYEASTRTRLSFESAILRLDGKFIHTENARDFSSAIKGESLEDSVRVVSGYADFLILRHFDDNSSKVAVQYSKIPVINAGSGKSQHPTQSLTDVYTIFQNFQRLDRLNILLIGDLSRGRTCNSLVRLLANFSGNSFCFVSPENCRAEEQLLNYLQLRNLKYQEFTCLERALEEFSADVIYVTRIQKERFESMTEYQSAKSKIILKDGHVNSLSSQSIIMHPLPRVDEIETAVDNNPRAKYFEQSQNGLFVRMALLKTINDHLKS